jgi:hypothetical protein
LNFENDKNNGRSPQNPEKRRHSITFNKEYFDFFEHEKYLNPRELQHNHNSDNKEDLSSAVFTMFLFFLLSFVLYILILILIQSLKLTLLPELDVLKDLTEIISQYNELTTSTPINSLNTDTVLNDIFNNSLRNSHTDFENFQKKFKIFDFIGIKVK